MLGRLLVVIGDSCGEWDSGGLVFDVGQVHGLWLLGDFEGDVAVARRMMVWSWRWSLTCSYIPGVCTGIDNGCFVYGKFGELIMWIVRDLRTTGVISVVVDLRGSLGSLRLSLLSGCCLEVLVDGRLFMKFWWLRSVSVATGITVRW